MSKHPKSAAIALPTDARLEAVVAGGIALWDAQHLMPAHGSKRYGWRGSPIRRLYVHHSGRLGAPGFAGARNSARYVVRKRGWPGPPYHYWLPWAPLYDEQERLVILRLQPDGRRSWHTGGKANGHGVAACLQGNTTTKGLSASQVELLEALIPWCLARHDLSLPDGLSWHSDSARYGGSGKRACPGREAVEWLTAYRAG